MPIPPLTLVQQRQGRPGLTGPIWLLLVDHDEEENEKKHLLNLCVKPFFKGINSNQH